MSTHYLNEKVAHSERPALLFSFLKRHLLLLVIASIWSLNASAQTAVQEVIVTASRTTQKIADAMNSTTLITREDIERSNSADLPSLLQ